MQGGGDGRRGVDAMDGVLIVTVHSYDQIDVTMK